MSGLRSDEEARKGKTLLQSFKSKRWGDRGNSCMKSQQNKHSHF